MVLNQWGFRLISQSMPANVAVTAKSMMNGADALRMAEDVRPPSSPRSCFSELLTK